MQWLKHAFAVESADRAEPTEREQQAADRVCREVVRRRLATPATLFLETFRPMNYLGSQAMHFFTPLVSALLDKEGYEAFADFLERRDSVDRLCRRIAKLEAECAKREEDEHH